MISAGERKTSGQELQHAIFKKKIINLAKLCECLNYVIHNIGQNKSLSGQVHCSFHVNCM